MYTAYFDRRLGSIYGVLTLQETKLIKGGPTIITKVFDRLPVSSGQQAYTGGDALDWVQGKGPTPIGRHWLSTKREPLLSAEPKGTPFYLISSYPNSRRIYGPNGVFREDAGVHLENGKPGTAGCTALLHDTEERKKNAWAFFAFLDDLQAQGIYHIPYVVL